MKCDISSIKLTPTCHITVLYVASFEKAINRPDRDILFLSLDQLL